MKDLLITVLVLVFCWVAMRYYLQWKAAEDAANLAAQEDIASKQLTGAKWGAVGASVQGVGNAVGGIAGAIGSALKMK